jgi:GntR family transcriptional repressor for pyruvate dehydrogenase complex
MESLIQEPRPNAANVETVPPGTNSLVETASDRAASYVRSLIFSGELRPGDWLPPGRELAERLGISRVTLRLGLKALEGAGYIVTSRGAHGGSRVSDSAQILRCWSGWLQQNADELEDIFEFRTNVETRIAWLAAERRSAEDLQRIEAADAMFGETRASLFRWDVEFHDALAQAAHSRRLEEAMIAVRGELFLPVDQALHEHRAEDVHALHKTIVAAVQAQDPPRAREAMRVHIEDTRSMIYRAMAVTADGLD